MLALLFRTMAVSLTLVLGQSILNAEGLAIEQPPMKAEPMKKAFVFSLLPKAFQAKPALGISVITEATEEGKRLVPPTPSNPTYYLLKITGYHMEGEGESQENTLSQESLVQEVKKSLALASYLEGTDEHPATQVLLLVWGEHNRLGSYGVSNTISRAVLVGGKKFAEELKEVMEAQQEADYSARGADINLLNPVYLFSIRNDKNRVLMEQVINDCYFVVISAYDKVAYDRDEARLLWRTKISTPAQGVSLAETSTALAASGSKYFGRWMSEPSIIDKRVSRKGKVELGETRTVTMDDAVDSSEKTKTAPATEK
ncbi:MAG: hypothetical protein QM715_09155 [Nibricoccus sp.]